ncbi:MAG: hypothetical protein ACC726_01745 [Chloroflexota bacterium]
MIVSQIGDEAIDISEEIIVVPNEDGTWGKICSELGGDGSDNADAESADADAGAIAEEDSESE